MEREAYDEFALDQIELVGAIRKERSPIATRPMVLSQKHPAFPEKIFVSLVINSFTAMSKDESNSKMYLVVVYLDLDKIHEAYRYANGVRHEK